MRAKHRILILLWTIILIPFYPSGYCSEPPRTAFHFIFENNFENDQPGNYSYDDYAEDWFSPDWNNRQGEIDIISENNNQFMRGHYPEGKYGAPNTGWSWNTSVPGQVTEMYFSQDIRFKPGFDWVLGGKIPGVQGGYIEAGQSPTYGSGFSARMMWKQDGRLVFYVYHQDQGGLYGDSYTWGNFHFETGKWYNITYRIVLNSITNGQGNRDGIMEGFVNGELVTQLSNFNFRNDENIVIDRIYMSSFFGGGDSDWATKRDEWMDVDNYVAFTHNNNVPDVPHGQELSEWSQKLLHPNMGFDDEDWKSSFRKDTIDGDQVTLSWANYPLPTDYVIERRLSPSAEYTQITSLSENTLSFTDTDLLSDNEYVYRIKAGTSTSNEVYVTTSIFGDTGENQPPDEGDEPDEPVAADPNTAPSLLNQSFNLKTIGDVIFIGKIQAFDTDKDQTLTYKIIDGNQNQHFILNEVNGELNYYDPKLDLYSAESFSLTIEVRDNGSPRLSKTALIKVNLNPNDKIVYINPSSTIDNGTGTFEKPFISWASVKWMSGYTYVQKRGTIAEEEKILLSSDNVILDAYGTGEKPIIEYHGDDYAIKAFEKSAIAINNIHFRALSAYGCAYFIGAADDNINIQACEFEGGDNGIRAINVTTLRLGYNTFKNTREAVYAHAKKTEIYYNLFVSNQTGINISSHLAEVLVYNNVFYDNIEGMSVSQSSATIYNNIFYLQNAGDIALNHSLDKLVSDNNIFYPEQHGFLKIGNNTFDYLADYQVNMDLDLNSFTEDPEFIDIYQNNFKLADNSPAINKAKYIGQKRDFVGNLVPYAGMPDIGMVEKLENILSLPNFGSTKLKLEVFPNPASEYVNVQAHDLDEESYTLKISDQQGKIISTRNVSTNQTEVLEKIDLIDFKAGTYIIALIGKSILFSNRITVLD